MKSNICLVLPVYNEENTIADTLIAFNESFKDIGVEIEFIISEDGSSDNSVEIIKTLSKSMNITLLSSEKKGNYNSAVLKGLSNAKKEIIAFVDSDGQYDPKDLIKMIGLLKKNRFIAGYRNPRVDTKFRKFISLSFKTIYYYLFKIKLIDPSCSYFVGYKDNVHEIITKYKFGHLPEGFWWEFYACCKDSSIEIIEHPVQHFKRNFGNTVVFKFKYLPKIGYVNIKGLFKLKKYLSI